MVRFSRGLWLGALALALGLGSAGCTGDTGSSKSSPPKEKAPPGMEMNARKQKEMAEKFGKGGVVTDQQEKDKDKDKENGKDKEKPKEKDKD